jgi:hypothetical protein
MKKEMLALMGEVATLREQLALPSPVQNHLAISSESFSGKDTRYISDAEYEIVDNKIGMVPEPNLFAQHLSQVPPNRISSLESGGRTMENEKDIANPAISEEQTTADSVESEKELTGEEARKLPMDPEQFGLDVPETGKIMTRSYIDADDLGIEYDEETGRFNGVPMNVLVDGALGHVKTLTYCDPEHPEKPYLEGTEAFIEETVPKLKPGWFPAKYSEKSIIAVDIYNANGLNPGNVSERHVPDKDYELMLYADDPMMISIYKHFIQNPPFENVDFRSPEKPYWEAFDIPFNPLWKKLVAQYKDGLTSGEIAIVRLLSNTEKFSTNYIAMYMRHNPFSKYFDGQYEDQVVEIKAQKDYYIKNRMPIPAELQTKRPFIEPLTYSMDLMAQKEFSCLMSAFSYAWTINNNTPFSIIEQLSDLEHNGRQRVMLSKYYPKTELREEWNIFKGPHPSCVYTNAQPNEFYCNYNAATKAFTISKKFKSTARRP